MVKLMYSFETPSLGISDIMFRGNKEFMRVSEEWWVLVIVRRVRTGISVRDVSLE